MSAWLPQLGTPLEQLTPAQRRWFFVLWAFVVLTRWLALASGPWEWDEILFADALRDFDVSRHRPHPPGYPGLVALGHLARLVTNTDFRALQAVSAGFAIAAFPSVAWLMRELRFDFGTSVGAALLYAFFPHVWFYGGAAFSDLPGGVLVVIASAAMLRGSRDFRILLFGALVLGFAAGVRPQATLAAGLPFALASWHRRSRPVEPMVAILSMVAVFVALQVGSILATGSFEVWRDALLSQRLVVTGTEWENPLRPLLFASFDEWMIHPHGAYTIGVVTGLLVLVSALHGIAHRRASVLLLLGCYAPVALFDWYVLSLDAVSRYAIAHAPLQAGLAADGAALLAGVLAAGRWWSPRVVFGTQIAALVAAMVAWTWEPLRVVRATPPPTGKAIRWIRNRSEPGREHVFVHTPMMPFAEAGLRGISFSEARHQRPDRAVSGPGWLVVDGELDLPDARVFRRHRGNLWLLARRRYFEVTVVPAYDGVVYAGGWYRLEGQRSVSSWRWMGRRSETWLPPVEGPAALSLTLSPPVVGRVDPHGTATSPRVTVEMNGILLDRFVLDAEATRTWSIDDGAGYGLLTIQTDLSINPHREGLSVDDRDLGLRLQALEWGPATPPPAP